MMLKTSKLSLELKKNIYIFSILLFEINSIVEYLKC